MPRKSAPQIILPINHYDFLRERLVKLNSFLTEEVLSPSYSMLYVDDLKWSIKGVKKELEREKV